MNIKRVIAKEGLIILGLAVVLYLLTVIILQNVPVILPQYRLEFANGEIRTIIINPEIRNDSDYRRLLEEAYNPPPELIAKRVKEFIKSGNIHSSMIRSKCVNPYRVYLSEIYSSLVGVLFILKLTVIYFVLLFIRFIVWSLKTLKKK